MTDRNKKTSFRIDQDLWSKFQIEAKDRGYSASSALRVLIIKFIKNEV